MSETTINVKIPNDTDIALRRIAAERQAYKSDVVREAILVLLGLANGGERLDSAADHLVVSCPDDDAIETLAIRCEILAGMLRERNA